MENFEVEEIEAKEKMNLNGEAEVFSSENKEENENRQSESLASNDKADKADGNKKALEGSVEEKKAINKKKNIVSKDLQRKFVIHFKKGQDEEAMAINNKISEICDSPIGKIPFDDIVLFLFEEKLEACDYEKIRAKAFDRKIESARIKYNRDNKTAYSMQEFLANAMGDYLS